MRMELKIPPPIVMLLSAALMWVVSRAVPVLNFTLPWQRVIAGCVVVVGVITSMSGVISFRRAGTTVNPLTPQKASSLVTSGIYQHTRNPMYLGLLLVLLAWAIFLGNILAFVMLPLFILYINRFQIEPEERALKNRFGRDFEQYQSHVRRWI